MKSKKSRRQPKPQYSLPSDPDAPIWGAPKIAIAMNLFKPDGRPDTDAVYYGYEQGHFAGVVFKNGGSLITSLRQVRSLATRTIEP
jgi:hypothetical protein